ncbi:MAG: pyruvate, phosphate dikinase, partial [Dehalococcoidaceae bacterium]|nr:pyruvate, phosphate dikinase [Dehalococcoidaceae bacterium]
MTTIKQNQSIYFFGDGKADGNAEMRDLLGGKGAGLAEMSNAGVPVPPGLTISTEVCNTFFENNFTFPEELKDDIKKSLSTIGEIVGAEFGSDSNPLLVSVRSGARVSMPGMMDTVLNLGLNDSTVVGLAKQSNDERFAYDSYRRFIAMFSDVVLGVRKKSDQDEDPFESLLNKQKDAQGVSLDTELSVESLKQLVVQYKKLV